tara:strand:- start:9202 stop:9732 length:531 start_codon:yes stop_codon:yes gene_type:complete
MAFYTGGLPLFGPQDMSGGYGNYGGGMAGNYGQSGGNLYVNPFRQGDQSAQDTLADLYEAEFQDYLNRFFPVEQDLIRQMTTGFGELQQEEINRAQGAVARQFANTRGQEMRRQAGFGVSLRPETQTDFQRAEASSLVAARNFARMRSEERRMQILSGGLGSGITDRSLTQGGLSG